MSETPFLFEREKKLIALLYTIGGTASATDFQKLLFLFFQRYESKNKGKVSATYEFVPYRYGAFSFSSYHDKSRLTRRGILSSSPDVWKLSKVGHRLAAQYVDTEILGFKSDCQGLRGNLLIAESYRKYPYYAIRSSIRDEMLKDDKSTLSSIEDVVPCVPKGQLFTIGYERRSIEKYLNQLIVNEVTVLLDVRRNAVSRRYGFSKRALENVCDKTGITYKHIPELGIDSQQRRGLVSTQHYLSLFKEYDRFLIECCDSDID